jgi:exodeoxyribonuclease-3
LRTLSVASWNVNGIRACYRKGFLRWLRCAQPDVVLLQEVRAAPLDVPEEIAEFPGYWKIWCPALKTGYSGTAIFTRQSPQKVHYGMGHPEFDREGRVVAAELPEAVVVSAYFPNSQDQRRRLDYKLRFCAAIEKWLARLRTIGKPVIVGGDYNIAPYPIDLARPKENEQTPGYLPEEREWMQAFLAGGWVDTFRHLHPEKVQYSWWSMRTRARDRGIGWRIDHHTIQDKDRDRIIAAAIQDHVTGSDHCPITLEVALG